MYFFNLNLPLIDVNKVDSNCLLLQVHDDGIAVDCCKQTRSVDETWSTETLSGFWLTLTWVVQPSEELILTLGCLPTLTQLGYDLDV